MNKTKDTSQMEFYPFELLPEIREIGYHLFSLNIPDAIEKLKKLQMRLEMQQNQFEEWCEERAEENAKMRLMEDGIPF